MTASPVPWRRPIPYHRFVRPSHVPTDDLLQRRLGEMIKGRYELRSVLGAGAQGAVYRAYDHQDQDEVAAKILHASAMKDSESRIRMFREAQVLVALRGTGAVAVLDQAFTPDGALCLITELLHGEDLETYAQRHEREASRVPLAMLPTIFEPIAKIMDAAHGLHIVHRDLKPENIFLHREGNRIIPRVLDFGFAKLLRLKKVTADGFVAGSPPYIAPETWRGEPVSYRVDLYALAVVLYRMLSGAPPLRGPTLADYLRQHIGAARPSLHAARPDLPPTVDLWVEQAMNPDPLQRFSTARAVWNSLWSQLASVAR